MIIMMLVFLLATISRWLNMSIGVKVKEHQKVIRREVGLSKNNLESQTWLFKWPQKNEQ